MSDNLSRGEQAAEEVARRWISTMQTMADQIQRQQQTYQQMMQESMNSYIQLLNTPPFYVSQQPQKEQPASGETFYEASQKWMELAQKQQQTLQQMSKQWMEQTAQQQQSFQRIVQQSLRSYMDLFNPSR